MNRSVIVWFRQDLRLQDNPALFDAAKSGRSVVPVFIWAPEEEGDWPNGAASRWWLHQSLKSLDRNLRQLGSRLVLRRGKSLEILLAIAKETRAESVVWNRRYEPLIAKRDSWIESELRRKGVSSKTFNAALLFEPWEIRNNEGKPYKVFTPFWNQCRMQKKIATPLPKLAALASPKKWPQSLNLNSLGLEPKKHWADGFRSLWRPGEDGAKKALAKFVRKPVYHYQKGRDLPAAAGTSRLSAHLHFGEISPHTVWHAIAHKAGTESFQRQIVWREFAYHLLYHFPHTPKEPLRAEFKKFPWKWDLKELRAWQKGKTGYPIVDAGMRELWATGWMHNRVRMITASFLVKHLLIPWQEGARWFWDTLVDADLANNTLGWQWVAGSGADAAPYFRIFNPVLQGEKFDPKGEYVCRWIPELKGVPLSKIHRPWETTSVKDYPPPVIDHDFARKRALLSYAKMKNIRTHE